MACTSLYRYGMSTFEASQCPQFYLLLAVLLSDPGRSLNLFLSPTDSWRGGGVLSPERVRACRDHDGPQQ